MTDSGPKTPASGTIVPPPLPSAVQTTATQPFSPAPSVATSAQLTELAKLLNRKMDGHADQLNAFHGELAVIRQIISSNADTMPSPPPDKSVLVRLGGHVVTVAQGLVLATGAVGIAMQVAALFKPSLVSPLQHLQQFLAALGGG